MKICANCGFGLPDEATFCTSCGTAIGPVPADAPETTGVIETTAVETPVSEASQQDAAAPETAAPVVPVLSDSSNITLCPDGKYRWVYSMPAIKNLMPLLSMWAVLTAASAIPFLITFVGGLASEEGRVPAAVLLRNFAIAIGVTLVISIVLFIVNCSRNGWKTVMLFELDEKGVINARQEKWSKPEDLKQWIAAIAEGSAATQVTMGAGLLAGTRSISKSFFARVSGVKAAGSKRCIKISERSRTNRVYVDAQDFDFVWSFVTSRCKKAKVE